MQNQINHVDKELKEKKTQLVSTSAKAAAIENELNAKRKEVGTVEKELESLSYDDTLMESLQKDRMIESETVQKLERKAREVSSRLGRVEFNYRDPENKFDRSRVKGVVAKLIKVKDGSAAVALEVAAGGKLFNVVVDTENTGKQLLQKGGLQRRVTIIPLNKIQSHPISKRIQDAAVKLVGQGNAAVALSLVGYDQELQMHLYSNSVAVVMTRNGMKGSLHQRILYGLLTGGSRKGGGELLRQLMLWQKLNWNSLLIKSDCQKLKLSYENDLEVQPNCNRNECLTNLHLMFPIYQPNLNSNSSMYWHQINELLPHQRVFENLKKDLVLKSHELRLLEDRAKQTEHHQLREWVQSTEEKLAEAKSAIIDKKVLESRLKDLEKKIKAIKTQMQAASENLRVCSPFLIGHKTLGIELTLARHETDRERLIMEMEANKKECLSLESQLEALNKHIEDLSSELDSQRTRISSIKKSRDEVQAEHNMASRKIKECGSQISGIVKKQKDIQQKISEVNLERKRMENEVKRMEMDQKDYAMKVDKMIEKHAWIASEKQLFGQAGSDYDFESRDPLKAREDFEKLEAEQSGLEKRVNKKVMAMFEKAEDEYNDLLSKKNIIENDKSKIKMVIEELDEKKETLKLESPEGGSFLDGLEVRVAFGSVWKQSLSELSGGQRSLLALSLILALLLFKPAPLYILDEVDAALDLSHTQNIGRMIKSHFPHSVSLKEGMFNNANVLFWTKFVDGVSTVQRTVTKQQSK
ncbi:hypothetical protein SASPL_115329 [Salvia splendens]|uniref:SMC hinge domain-containing protein n=1 Tax=Salvia splendens TaxID=180675 RepID=A0A8X8Y850_SALSN|nr:hypothetical protein SASPL_115329 [Salvia splendens]